ncbi:MAG: fibronectin type III domain-containing protein [Patescibacteria group bacterium]
MQKKTARFLIVFVLVFGISLSNVPFYFLSDLTDAYIASRGIVDQMWLVQQDGNPDIVDKFEAFRTIVRKLEIHEAEAAITYQTPGAIAYSTSGGTSVSPAYPASIAANNLLMLVIGMKPSVANGGSVTTPSGWTAVPSGSLTGAGGYGVTLGADTGNTNVFTYYKVAAGTESGTLAVTIASNGVSWAQMYRYTNASGSWSVAGTTGSDTSAGSVSIAFGANPGVTTGDNILAAMVIPTDVTTAAQFSAEAFSQTGITFGTVTEISEPDSTVGNDIGGFTVRVPISSGTASGNPTLTATAGGTTTNVRGPGVFIRIREANTAPTLTITQPDGTGDTVNVGDLYNITYDLADPDPLHAVTAAMYYDTDASGLNGTAITGACATAAEGTGATCSWNTTGMTPGTYYVYGLTSDGIAAQVNDYSPGIITINAPSATTTIGNGTNPGNSTVAPGSAITDLDAFTLIASSGTDSVTALTVTLTGASSFESLSEVRITSDNGSTLYFSAVANPSSNTVNFSGGTPVPVTTSSVQFKVRITPKTHANMPVPPGTSYGVGGTITAFTSTNTQAGSDSGSATITVDNASANGATSTSGSAGGSQVTLNWTTSNSSGADGFSTGADGVSVVLRWAASTPGSEVPAEGSSYSNGNTIGTATVACVRSTDPVSTAVSGTDGAGTGGCSGTALTNGQAYSYKVFQKDLNGNYDVGVTFTGSPFTPQLTLTISITAGAKIATKNSGDVNQYAHDTACTGAATCAAFTLAATGGTINVSVIKITESSTTVDADSELSDMNLYYDTDGNWSDAGAETLFGTAATFAADQTVTVSGTLAISSGTTAYVYVRYDLANGTTYPLGGATVNFQIAAAGDVTSDGTESGSGTLAGTQTILPKTDSVTYAVSGDGGRSGDTATISGKGFGAPSADADQQDCTTVTVGSKGCVRFVVGGNATVLGSNISTWNNTTITFTIAAGLASFGGSTALEVVAAAQSTAPDLTYYMYPNITSVTTPLVADAAREAEDITLNGDHFDTNANQGTVTFQGGFSPSQSASIVSWSDTAVTVTVPAAIDDNDYTGDVLLTRAAATGSKTDLAYGANGFRILPRITGFTPGSGTAGDPVQVDGDHFCQNGGACPGAFDANNKVTFTSSVDATVFTSWTNTAMNTQVPSGAVTGNVVLKSNGYDSNGMSFTVVVPTPTTPTILWQSRNSGFTDLIATGGMASSTPVYFAATTTSGVGGGTMYLQTELRPTIGGSSTFSSPSACSAAACTGLAYCFEGTGVAYSSGNVTITSSTTTADDLYHWQTRVRYNKSGTDYCSAWQCYPDSGCNSEAATDFELDDTPPAITGLAANSITTNTATIAWNTTGDTSSSQVAYGTDALLGAGTATTTETDTAPTVTVHSVPLSNLSCGTTYYYRARSRDDAGIVSFSAIQNFQTGACPSQPAKTTVFHIIGSTGIITNGAPLNQSFPVSMPETATTTKSAFVEITGVYASGASSKDIAVQVNSQAARTYVVPASTLSHFKIIYSVSPVGATNTLVVTPQANTTVYITSAKFIVTYAYTP